MKYLNTPENRLTVFMLTILAYLLLPLIFGLELFFELTLDNVSSEADSLGIPIAGSLILWIVGFPFVVIACCVIEWMGRGLDSSDLSESKCS